MDCCVREPSSRGNLPACTCSGIPQPDRRVPVWPLCMETLRPMHLNSVQQALADWCAHIHTCALHVHMGSFTSMGWACLLVVEAQHVHDQWASHATTRAPGHTCAFTAEFGLLWDTHPGGRAELDVEVLSSLPA